MDLKFYFKLFVRRLHYFLIVVALGTAAGGTVATILPDVYVAQALLQVEDEQIPGDLAASTVQVEATVVLDRIRQGLLTRGRLLELANDYEIYGPPTGPRRQSMSPDDVVEDLRGRIQIVTTGGAGRRGPAQALFVRVSFEAGDARLAAEVANAIVTAILEQNTELRRSLASQTRNFFQDEVARLDQELAARSARILAFREANLEALPDSLDFRRTQQASAQERLLQLGRSESLLRERRNRQVELFEATGQVTSRPAVQLTEAEQALNAKRRQIQLAEATLGEANPRMVALRAEFAALEAIVAEERGVQTGAEATDAPDPQLSLYELSIMDIDSQLEFIAEQRAQVEQELEDLRASIQATPGNAVTLATMERDYAALRMQYDEAITNRARAETGETIENLAKGQRISVIEQAAAPSRPTSPDRPIIAAGGVALGLGAGLGIVVLLELLNSAIRRPADLQTKLGITPFGTLPLIRTPGQIRRRRAVLVLAFLCVAAGVPASLWYIQTEVMPLDMLLDRVLDQVGIASLSLRPPALV